MMHPVTRVPDISDFTDMPPPLLRLLLAFVMFPLLATSGDEGVYFASTTGRMASIQRS